MSHQQPPAYKELTLHQLRSFCETARRGSLTAAAAALGLAHPTVWKQVHALEKAFGVALVEPHVRGCTLTEAGHALLALVAPNIDNLDALRARFDEAVNNVDIRIVVAGPPRLLAEDLPHCLLGFTARWPRARVALLEMSQKEVGTAVAAGDAHLGFTSNVELNPDYARLSVEPWYAVDVFLVTPRNHPLAHKSRIRPEDLKKYPLVNAWDSLRDPAVHAVMVKLGLFQTQPRLVEARHAAVIRRCVALGLGIGLVSKPTHQPADADLHERLMSHVFGRSQVYLVRPSAAYQHPAVGQFAAEVRNRLGRTELGTNVGRVTKKRRV